MVFKGNIDTTHIPTIYQLFYFSGKNGILELFLDSLKYEIYFLHGNIVNIKNNFIKSTLLENYFIANEIPIDKALNMLKLANNHNEILKKLIEQKIISKELLKKVKNKQYEELASEIIGLEIGSFKFNAKKDEEIAKEKMISLDVQNLLMNSLDLTGKMADLMNYAKFNDSIVILKKDYKPSNYLEYYILKNIKNNITVLEVLSNGIFSLYKTLTGMSNLINKGIIELEANELYNDEIKGFYPEEFNYLENESDMFKEAYDFYIKGMYTEALKLFENLKGVFPGNLLLNFYIIKCYLYKRNEAKALKLLKEVNKMQANNILVYLFLSRIFIRISKFEEAEKYIKKGLSVDINNLTLLWEYGNLLMKQKKEEEAIKIYNKILSLNPKNINTLNKLAAIYLKNNNIDEAIKYWKKVLSINKNDFIAKTNLKVVQNESGR